MAITRLSMKARIKGRGADHAAYIACEGRFANRLEQGEKSRPSSPGTCPPGRPATHWLFG